MATSDKRREVAARLRENANKHGVVLDYLGSTQVESWWLLLHTIGCDSNEQEVAFRTLADLIDPTCDIVFTDVSGYNGDGTWEQDCDITCSACGHDMEGFGECLDEWQAGYAEKPFEHCPFCGARITRIDYR